MSYFVVDKIQLRDWGLETNLAAAAKKAEHAVAVQAAKDTSKFVPFLTGSLKNRTQVKDNLIIYPGPYARYLYYGKRMVNAKTGKGPGFIEGVGYRWRKGTKLRPTSQDIQLAHEGIDPHAQSHWFEVSKGENLDKWKRIAQEVITHYGGK